jgi:hypothetical protein
MEVTVSSEALVNFYRNTGAMSTEAVTFRQDGYLKSQIQQTVTNGYALNSVVTSDELQTVLPLVHNTDDTAILRIRTRRLNR